MAFLCYKKLLVFGKFMLELERLEEIKKNIETLEASIDKIRKEDLEKKLEDPTIWDNPKAAGEISQELSQIKEKIEKVARFKKELEDIKEFSKMENLSLKEREELQERFKKLDKEIQEEILKSFLNEKYDKYDAIMTIEAGAGGREAEDWAAMILEMYQRYCQKKGFEVNILDQDFSEGVGPDGRWGIKEATLEIKGKYAFGILKKESGVHRLVRISPFSAKSLRHTSFCKVEVIPKLRLEESEIKINPNDLKIETLKASGPGGQYVNKRETKVRITHLPTGIVVSSQAERNLAANKERAMEILLGKLYQLSLQKVDKEVEKFKGRHILAEFGNQIRSYVFQPYQLVKDNRTGVETSNIAAVMAGEIDEFIEAEIKNKNL